MATIVLSAAGMALGGSIGGSVLGLSSAVIGRAAGAMLGRAIDERLLGAGSAPVEHGRIDRFRLTGASEGAAVARVHGAVRVGGQVIWATRFLESSQSQGGGKGAPQPQVTTFSYTVSLAIALCEGAITGIGRIWADGTEIPRDDLQLSVYPGTEGQLPDPRMEAVEGPGRVPAYRGLAYVVIEDLPLGRFGNRVPQFSFEVFRPAPQRTDDQAEDMARLLRAWPSSPARGIRAGHHARPPPARLGRARGRQPQHAPGQARPPRLARLALHRAAPPAIREPRHLLVRRRPPHGPVPRRAQGRAERGRRRGDALVRLGRFTGQARLIAREDGRSIYGGTPADASVIDAIREIRSRGKEVVFYPFLLMDQLPGNALPNPYGGAASPRFPGAAGSRPPSRLASPARPTAPRRPRPRSPPSSARPSRASSRFTRRASSYSGPAEWSFPPHDPALCPSLRGGGGVTPSASGP
jgi:hypothetical protein